MERIYSNIKRGTLLHLVYRCDEIKGRTNVSPIDEFLQLASIEMSEGDTFKPHKHIYKKGKDTVIPQESWVVLKGRVKVVMYDLDDTIVATPILEQGDLSMTFRGGHNYIALEEGTLVYEYKTGPYEGQALDKEFIK